MHTIKAIYNGVDFVPKQQIPVSGQYKVTITFDEPIVSDIADDTDEMAARMAWLDKIEAAIELSADEDLSGFPKQGLMKTSYEDWV